VMDVMSKLGANTLAPGAARTTLIGLGLPEEDVEKMVTEALTGTEITPSDRAFQREVLKSLLTVPQAREAVYNGTDIEDLIKQTGLPVENGYEAPYAAVVAPTGPLNSGAVITDPDGAIVGADVENDLPAESGGRNAPPNDQQDPPDDSPATDDSEATSTAGRKPGSAGAATAG
jgi:hypothetical protein